MITNEQDKEIPKERYISPKEKQTFIDDLKLNLLPRRPVSCVIKTHVLHLTFLVHVKLL